jgi:hypothetical protein
MYAFIKDIAPHMGSCSAAHPRCSLCVRVCAVQRWQACAQAAVTLEWLEKQSEVTVTAPERA